MRAQNNTNSPKKKWTTPKRKKVSGVKVRWAFAAVIITAMSMSSTGFSNSQSVQKAGSRYPDITNVSHNRWVAIRGKSKNSNSRVYAMLATGEHSRALVAARAFMIKNPGKTESFLALATALSMNGQARLGAYYAKQALKMEPGNSEALNILGLAQLTKSKRVSDYKKAISFFQQSFSTDSKQIASGLNSGHLFLELGDAKRAHNQFGQVAVRCNDCPTALIGMGIAKRRLGKYSQAKKLFEEALDRDPKQYAAKYNLALTLKDGFKEYGDAKQLLQEVLDESPSKFESIRSRSEAVMAQLVHKQLRSIDRVNSIPKPIYVNYKEHENGFGGLENN